MTAYKTKITVRTNGKVYQPGTILPKDISKTDLEFLKEKKFVEVVDAPAAVVEDQEDTIEGDEFDGFDEFEPDLLKSEDEIRKIRSKKEVAEYAETIGLNLENYEERPLKELQDEVINLQEQKENEEV